MADTDHDLLIRLDEKVDALHKKVDTLTNDHEKRIRSLEKQRWMIIGGATAVSTLANLGLVKILS